MEITDVRVRKIAKEGKMKAIVSITLDDEFVVHDIKVIEGEKGLLSQCRAKRHQTVSIGISRILLTQIPETEYSLPYLQVTKERCLSRKWRGKVLL